MPTCCQGCVSRPDATFFEFPTSRLLRKRWLDAMPRPPPRAPPVSEDARLCSLHFAAGDYEEVRGRVRLRRKVVPTIFGDQTNKPQSIKDPLDSLNSTEKEQSQDAQTDKHTTCNDNRNENVGNHDENIDSHSENVDNHNQNVDNHSQNVDKYSGSVDGQNKNVDIHRDNIDGHNDNVGNHNENIDNHSENVHNHNQTVKHCDNVDNHNENVDNHNENVDNHSGNADGHNEIVDNLNKSSDNEKVDNGQIETELQCSQDVMDGGHTDNNNKDVANDNGRVSNNNETVLKDREKVKDANETENADENLDKPLKKKVKKKLVPMRKTPFKRRKMSEDSEDSVNSDEPPPPVLEDLEEQLPNYHIANMRTERQVAAMSDSHPPVRVSFEQDEVEEMVLTPHVPVYIELSVGQDGSVEVGGQQNDCLMVMESVQCDVDVALMLEARGDEGEGAGAADLVDLGDDDDDDEVTFMREDRAPSPKSKPVKCRPPVPPAPAEAVSLLTSSDSDDVVLQEPHVDTLSLSSETDEDDVPLHRLLASKVIPPPLPLPLPKLNKKKKKKSQSLKNVLVHQADYFCMQCNHVSLTRSDYSMHRRAHREDAGNKSAAKVYQMCKECGFTTSSGSQLRRHRRGHLTDKRYRCPLCAYRCKHNMTLLYHLQTHDLHPDRYNCGACGLALDCKERLLEHQGTCRRLGGEGGRHACRECGFVARGKRALKVHRNTAHSAAGSG